MSFIDKIAVRRVQKLLKNYSDAGSLSTYDRAFADIFKKGGSSKDYVGAIRDAIEVHSFYFTKADFRIYKSINGKEEEFEEHPFSTMFERPNSEKTWWEYAYMIPVYWGLWGVNYFHVKRNLLNGEPFAYQQLPPALIEKKYDVKTGRLTEYIYNDGTNKIYLNINDIIEIKYPNPYSQSDGFAIVESVADQKIVNELQMHYMRKFFENGGFMGLVFTTKQEMRKVNFDRTLQMLEDKFMGRDNAYKQVGLFDSGLEPVKASYSIKDMDITESRKLTKEDIFQAWKVADIMVGRGTMDRAGNEAAIYQFTSGIIDPLLSYIDNCFTLFIQKEWGDKTLEVEHDTLAPKDVQAQLKYYDGMSKLGALTINEIREEEGYNRFEYELADQPIINVGGSIVRIDTGKQIGVEDAQTQKENIQGDNSQDPDQTKSLVREDIRLKDIYDERWLDLKWKQFNTRLDRVVRKFERSLGNYLSDQERRILEATLNNFVVGEAFNLQDENMLLHQLLEIDLWDIMKNGYRYGDNLYEATSFDKERLNNDFQKLANNTLQINETTLKQIKDVKNPDELKTKYKQIRDSRLEMISVTTALGAFNAGLLQAMKDAGLNKKMWLSMRDAKVRDAHKMMDGVTIDIDMPFEVEVKGKTYLGMYPGDATLDAVNNANCRCTIIAR